MSYRMVSSTLLVSLALTHAAAAVELELATLAPERSPWTSAIKSFAAEVKQKTGGALLVNVRTATDSEAALIERMAKGELQGATLSGAGLAALAADVAVLEAPRLITTYRQLDAVRDALRTRLEKALAEKGYVVLGWGDAGQTFLFTATPVPAPSELAKTKPWIPTGDTALKSLYEEAGAKPTPLAVNDVVQNLKTGDVDAFCATPLSAVALQWFERAKFVTGIPLGVGVGATIVTRKAWASATPEQQKTLKLSAERWHRSLVDDVRAENVSSLKALKKRGVEVVPVTGAGEAAWDALAVKVQDAQYPKALLNEVRRIVKSSP